jgi:hypothetical protein
MVDAYRKLPEADRNKILTHFGISSATFQRFLDDAEKVAELPLLPPS